MWALISRSIGVATRVVCVVQYPPGIGTESCCCIWTMTCQSAWIVVMQEIASWKGASTARWAIGKAKSGSVQIYLLGVRNSRRWCRWSMRTERCLLRMCDRSPLTPFLLFRVPCFREPIMMLRIFWKVLNRGRLI